MASNYTTHTLLNESCCRYLCKMKKNIHTCIVNTPDVKTKKNIKCLWKSILLSLILTFWLQNDLELDQGVSEYIWLQNDLELDLEVTEYTN